MRPAFVIQEAIPYNTMIWHAPVSIERLNESTSGTLMDALGIRFAEVGDDFLTATMPVDHRTVQPAGLLHGGASAALGETVASAAAFHCVDRTRFAVVGTEINASHVRSVRSGTVVCTARPLRLGSTLHVWEFQIVDDGGRTISKGRLSVAVVPLS